MSKVISLLILSSYIFVIGIKTFPVIEYLIDYDNISENLCENKDNPDLGCNGKCYLYKKSRKLQENEEDKKALISEKLSLEYTRIAEFAYAVADSFGVAVKATFIYILKHYPLVSDRVLAPPKVLFGI